MTKARNMDLFAEFCSFSRQNVRLLGLRVVDASLDPDTTLEYLEGQANAYRAFCVEGARLPNWVSCPVGTVHLVTVRDLDGKMVAGARVHVRRAQTPLPVEERVAHPQLRRTLAAHARTAEVCGVWVADNYRKTGASDFTFLGSVALASALNISVVALCAHTAVMPLYERYGMCFDRSLCFAYPDDRYQTYAGLVDLEFAARANHPARLTYATMMASIFEGQNYRFEPELALNWNCPRAPELDWKAYLPRSQRRPSMMAPATEQVLQF